MRNAQRPTRTEQKVSWEDYTESHPAYALIGASRVNSYPGTALFGSDFLHHSYIMVRISHGELSRGLSHDRAHSTGDQIVEVALSEAQWATFLSTLNMGDGVPCTLRWLDGDLPGIAPDLDRRAQHRAEVDDTLRDAVRSITELRDAAPNKKLRDMADRALTELTKNLDFVGRSFDKHAEQTIERAKTEVAAYIARAVERAGLQALGGQAPILELPTGSEVNEVTP